MSSSKIGLILINIGTPSGCDTGSVQTYLSEFLTDPDVIQAPWFVREILMKQIVVPRRAPKSALKYQAIWTKQGSPLMVESVLFQQALQKKLGDHFKVVIGMRYGAPSLFDAAEQIKDCQSVILAPMYPQYAQATTASSLKKAEQALQKINPSMKIISTGDFYQEDFFQKALLSTMTDSLRFHQDPEAHWLFSFHGLPESQIKKTPGCYGAQNCCENFESQGRRCYRAQCLKTAQILAGKAGLSAGQWSVSFQSRLGPVKWIQPYTDQRLKELAAQGVKKLFIMAPAFVVDGLETLEEICVEGRHTFIQAGGEQMNYIPCLNSNPLWVQGFSDFILETLRRGEG